MRLNGHLIERMIVKLRNKKHKVQKAGLYTLPLALKCQAGKLYAMSHIRVNYLSKAVLDKFMLKLTINTGLIYMYFKSLTINHIKTSCCLEYKFVPKYSNFHFN